MIKILEISIKRTDNLQEDMGIKTKIKPLQECKDDAPKNVRLMGLDLGKKTIGLAISDSVQSIATPLTTIKRTKFAADAAALIQLIDENEVGGLIIGWPLNMDGSTGPRCDATLSFIDELQKVPEFTEKQLFIALWDERLSTQEVDNFLDNRVDIKRNKKFAAKEEGLKDALAAQIILQSAIDTV